MAWTKEEIALYQENMLDDPVLRTAYFNERIPSDQPEKRAKYLAEDILKITMTDHNLLMNCQNKIEALVMLEQMFCDLY